MKKKNISKQNTRVQYQQKKELMGIYSKKKIINMTEWKNTIKKLIK